VPPAVNTFFEERLERLFELARRIEQVFADAGLEYRVVGGLASYLYVEAADPEAGRLTRDIDILVPRRDLPTIAEAASRCGFEYRPAAGVDMLVQVDNPSGRRAVHLVLFPELRNRLDEVRAHE